MFAGGIGIQEIVIILIVGLLVFGAARLPKIARSLGQGIKEFKKTVKGLDSDDDDESTGNVRYVQNPQNYQVQQPYPQGQQYAPQQGPGPAQSYQPYGTNPQQNTGTGTIQNQNPDQSAQQNAGGPAQTNERQDTPPQNPPDEKKT
jgi:sec-independent protein translocase protein TatA